MKSFVLIVFSLTLSRITSYNVCYTKLLRELNGQQIWFSPKGWDDYERVETQLSRDYSTSPENPARGGKSILKGAKNDDGRISYVENITFESYNFV